MKIFYRKIFEVSFINKNIIEILKKIEEADKSIISPIENVKEAFNSLKKVTIIRSANLNLTMKFIDFLINQNYEVDLITFNRDFELFQEKYPNIGLISYDFEITYSEKNLKKFLESIDYEIIAFLYNNTTGEGYLEIEKALEQELNVLIYNADSQLIKINNMKLKVQNQRLKDELINWYLMFNERGENH